MIVSTPHYTNEELTQTYSPGDMMRMPKGDELRTVLKELPKNHLEEIRKTAGKVIDQRFERGRGPALYGHLPRCFSARQLRTFFDSVKNPVVRQAFLVQFYYALRVGELSSVRIAPYQELVIVNNHKAGRTDYLPLIPGTEWLFDDLEFQSLSSNYLRKCFRAICRDAGPELTFVYSTSKNTDRSLYQFTTHSLRHTSINMVRKNVDEYTASVYARHCLHGRFGETATYFHKSLDDLKLDLQKVFKPYLLEHSL